VESPQAVVVDTCVVSIMFKENPLREAYERHLRGRLLIISPMTLAELERWALARNWGTARRYRLDQYLKQYVVQPFSRALCQRWAQATHSADQNRLSISCSDAWVAAVALLNDIPLVTHHWKHFRGVDNLKIISENDPDREDSK